MTDASTALSVAMCGREGLAEHRAEIVAAYGDAYGERLNDPFASSERYEERLSMYAKQTGFVLVTGRVQGALAGYCYGFTLPREARWWHGFRGEDESVLDEDGRCTYALVDIAVRPAWRRRGYARALHDGLLHNRPERRATLLVRPTNAAAQNAYRSWGWYKIGELQPSPDAPIFDSLVLDLSSLGSEGIRRR